MEYLSFSLLTEEDFDEVVVNAGGKRYTDNPSINELNCDYIFEDAVIELKIIEEEPIEKETKQIKIANLFRSDLQTVILNPHDLDHEGQRKYYQELATPIKGQLKKASKQLQASAKTVDSKVKIAMIMNNGLTMTSPDEFKKLAIDRAKNDTSGIDILLVCGIYYFSDKFDMNAIFAFEDIQIRGESRPELIQKLRTSWLDKVEKYMTTQMRDISIKRTKEPIKDLYFELNGIRYVKPPLQWGKPSSFYGERGRPREDTTGMTSYPPVAKVLPTFDDECYMFVKNNLIDDSILTDSLQEYLEWAKKQISLADPLKPVVLIKMEKRDLKTLKCPFSFNQVAQYALPKFQDAMIQISEKVVEFSNQSKSMKYILLQVNEIGMDKANDIAFISHNEDDLVLPRQHFIIKGDRMKFEYALLLASAHCLSLGAETVYYYRNEDFKWK